MSNTNVTEKLLTDISIMKTKLRNIFLLVKHNQELRRMLKEMNLELKLDNHKDYWILNESMEIMDKTIMSLKKEKEILIEQLKK